MIIILFQPLIPQNTGNIIRTCAALEASLLLVGPLGFRTSDRMMRRAGLDYGKNRPFEVIDDLPKYLASKSSFYFFSSKKEAKKSYTEASYTEETVLIFGNEKEGLPKSLWERWPERFVTIPMAPRCRCLNLSNACAVAGFEMRRQLQQVSQTPPE
ncbi:MAG: TrmH family RNA methyltransferase [Chlamydiota bacterium]